MDVGTQAGRLLLKIPPWLCYWDLPMKKAYSRLMLFSGYHTGLRTFLLGNPSPHWNSLQLWLPDGPNTIFKKIKEREKRESESKPRLSLCEWDSLMAESRALQSPGEKQAENSRTHWSLTSSEVTGTVGVWIQDVFAVDTDVKTKNY